MAAARRDTVPPSPDARRGVTEVPLLPGQELRDEFTCPITRALMRVPVIAADGHTYCRAAIERWLLHHSTSPKTGEPLEHRHLVPNHNLKRLIDDLVAEGGSGARAPRARVTGHAPRATRHAPRTHTHLTRDTRPNLARSRLVLVSPAALSRAS